MRNLVFIIFCLLSSSLYAQQDTLEEFVDFKIAEYAGGEQGLQMCLAQHVKYPEEALMNDVMGTVYVQFVIDTFGRVINLELDSVALTVHKANKGSNKKRLKREAFIRNLIAENNYGIVAAAIAAVQQCEDWEPAIQKGKKVNMRYRIPVKFMIF